MLEKDSKIFPSSLLTNLIQIIMPHDYVKALEMATEIADVLALSGDFNIFMPIARLLLFPTIYESALIYGTLFLSPHIIPSLTLCAENEDEARLEEKIKNTKDDRQLVEKLLNKNDILEQLTFMKYVEQFQIVTKRERLKV